jgi:hypothetical protein
MANGGWPMEVRAMGHQASNGAASTSKREEAKHGKSYDDKVKQIRDEVFGSSVHVSSQSKATRVLARPLRGKEVASWYFLPPQEMPGFQNEEKSYLEQRKSNRRIKDDEGLEKK